MWLSEVSRVTPGIKSLYPGVPDPQLVPAESVRIRVAESIRRVLEVLGDGGSTLVVFDDVQHMDPATRDVLHVLLRRLEAVPTLLLGTLRTSDWRNFGLISDPGVSDFQWHETVPLKPFGVAEAEALIASRLCDAETIDEAIRGKIIELAEGNPYLLEMLLSDWQRDGGYSLVAAEAAGDGTGARWRPPDTMRRAFERQYRGLSSEAQRLLAVLAVAGKKITPSQISDLASLTSHEINRAVFEAIDRGIVRVDGASFGFKNEMHRAFVYYALLTEESRKYHHARMARSFGTQPDAGDFQRALEGAHHFLKAGLVQSAIAQVIPGAEVAINRGAPQEAERALKEILSHQKFDNAPAIHILYAKSLIAQGQYRQVVNVLSELAEVRVNIAQEAEIAVLKAEALHRGSLSDTAAIAEAAGAATRTAEEAGAEVALSRALQIRAEMAAQETDLEELERIAMRSKTITISTSNEEVLGLANITHAFCQMVSGEYREATRDLLKAELSMRKLSREIDLRMVLNGLGICHTNTGDFRAAESKFQEAASTAHRLGDCFSESLAWDNLGVLYDDLGWFDRAARAYRQALVLCLKSPTAPRIAHILSNMASLSISIGNLQEADAVLAQAEAQARSHNRLKALIEVLVTRADLYLAREQDELAWQTIEDVRVLSAGKSPVDGTAGQFQRLNLQFLWATEGATAIQGLTNVSTGGLGNRLARRFEIQALIDMILEKERRTVNVVPIVQTIVEYGLFGVMARLVALRIWSSNSLQPRTGESGAHAVARLFPDPRRSVIPEAVAETSLLTECC
jgi:Flp pilus assembly protein TadD